MNTGAEPRRIAADAGRAQRFFKAPALDVQIFALLEQKLGPSSTGRPPAGSAAYSGPGCSEVGLGLRLRRIRPVKCGRLGDLGAGRIGAVRVGEIQSGKLDSEWPPAGEREVRLLWKGRPNLGITLGPGAGV